MSLLVVLGAYVGARLFAVVSPITLAFVVLLSAFTAPKAYEAKQEEVDRVLAAAKSKLDELGAKFKDK
ncbi:hypothetical protein GPECTOR_4g529 [Gonium pectorale]|uniref:Reticulon-like protein n=1 Tax=Gonium pectorale TaxID=33097 RepID=A0A150GXB8_GONPE|nr:hypothetical protein GPECTOR_4g529 [Gonium pectorale]|eukprot:KXZ54464.1 hypothetical protein GPECTOR_4g529 [Gonium pectorale]